MPDSFIYSLLKLLEAGVSLVKAVEIQISQTKKFKLNLIKLHSKLCEGFSFHTSIKYAFNLSHVYLSFIKVGEETGKLEQVLQMILKLEGKKAKLRSNIKKAIFYPCIVLVATIFSLALMVKFVIPELYKLYLSFQVDIKGLASFIFGFSNFVGNNFNIILFFIVFIILGLYRYKSILTSLPVIGTFVQKSTFINYFTTLHCCLTAGVSLQYSLRLLQQEFKELDTHKLVNSVGLGVPLNKSLKELKGVPEHIVNYVAIGEESGKLEEMLSYGVQNMEQELNDFLTKVVGYIEPGFILFLGIIIAILIIGVYLPFFDLAAIL